MNMFDRPEQTQEGVTWVPGQNGQPGRLAVILDTWPENYSLTLAPYGWTVAYRPRTARPDAPWCRPNNVDVGLDWAQYVCGAALLMFGDYEWSVAKTARTAPGPDDFLYMDAHGQNVVTPVTFTDDAPFPPGPVPR